MNEKKAPSWLSIMWKGVMAVIDAKGRIRAERKVKTARRISGNGFCYVGWVPALLDVLLEELKSWMKSLIQRKH